MRCGDLTPSKRSDLIRSMHTIECACPQGPAPHISCVALPWGHGVGYRSSRCSLRTGNMDGTSSLKPWSLASIADFIMDYDPKRGALLDC